MLLSARMKNDRRAYKNSYYLHIAADRKSFSIDGKTYFFQRDGKRKINLEGRGREREWRKLAVQRASRENCSGTNITRILQLFTILLDQYFHTIVFVKKSPELYVSRCEIEKEKFRSFRTRKKIIFKRFFSFSFFLIQKSDFHRVNQACSSIVTIFN